MTGFASALRNLRDGAPASAASIESLVVDHKVAASTIYAALNGKRLPSRKTLAKIVSAWGGIEAEWMKLRTEAEARVQRAHIARAVDPQLPPSGAAPSTVEDELQRLIDDTRRDHETARNEFLRALLLLRAMAGNPTLRMLANVTGLPRSTLADHLAGRRIPSRAVGVSLISALVTFAPNDVSVRDAARHAGALLHRLR
ncbi:hypothetical protein OHV13_30480 [Kitasatospora purpeofusca]|uniref:hypothetical protein n=1 Tax=Kitasatospora purpeofusca TaxID=67352 RepID=UPI00324FDD1E